MDFNFLIAVIVAVFAIVNPLGNVSFFVALTEGYNHKDRLEVINKAVFVAAGILIIFALVGNLIFEIFSITIPAFRIAGGILLFSIAFSMLRGSRPKTKLTDRDKEEALERQAVGIVPLGVPMLAGPGAITTVMLYMVDATTDGFDVFKVLAIIIAVIITMSVAYVMLYYGEGIFKRLGRVGALAFSRIMGLILAAMAVQFVLTGLVNFALQQGLV
ncbi:MAG: MarC family protein [Thermoplasmata archaeon]|nr:MarC family protein [Thermoplasmata archaeon]